MTFQVDTKKIKLGDSIPQQQCEQIVGCLEADYPQQYQFLLLQLLGVVQKQLKQQFNREVTVRIIKQELHVLTDQEAAAYNPRRFDAGLRLARRAHRRLLAVNVGKLTPVEREAHTKNVFNQSHKLAQLRKRVDTLLPAAERTTPVMQFRPRGK